MMPFIKDQAPLNTGKTRFKKGHVPWNKGINGKKSHMFGNKHSLGSNSWIKGLTKETNSIVKKIAESRAGQERPDMIGNKYREGMRSPNWKGGVTTQDKLERIKFRDTMQKQIFEKDDYTCQLCGQVGGQLQVDHIQSWKDYVELRFSMDNCRTLCMSCHYEITYRKPMPESTKAWGHNLKKVQGGGETL